MKSGVSLRRARPTLVHTSQYSRLKTDYAAYHPEATIPRAYYTCCVSIRIRHNVLMSCGTKIEKERNKMLCMCVTYQVLLLFPSPVRLM